MFRFDLEKFANASSRGSQKPYHEIPGGVPLLLELRLEKPIIGIADHVFEEVLLLYFNETHFEFLLLDQLQILIDSLESEIDSLWLVVLHKIAFVSE